MFEDMQRKTTVALTAGVLAALGAGSIAVAATTGTTKAPTPAPATTPATGDVPETPGDKADTATSAGDRPETPGDTADATSTERESTSEAVDADGPGGHHDEPGNPNADTQQEGVH